MKKSGAIIFGLVILACLWSSVQVIVRGAQGGSMRIGRWGAGYELSGPSLLVMGIILLIGALSIAWSVFQKK